MAGNAQAPLVELPDPSGAGDPSSASPADEHVVSCAAALFLSQGIASVRMTDIAQAAGMGVATLYRHFSTKGNLAVAAGTLMWRRFNARIVELVESDGFLAQDGYHRLGVLLGTYSQGYTQNPGFVRFLDEFDHLVVTGEIGPQGLDEYGRAVDSFYVVFDDCYLLGRQDGSISREVDFEVFYRAVAHALMGIAEKLMRGEVIPSDDFSHGREELDCIVDMALRSLAGPGEGAQQGR